MAAFSFHITRMYSLPLNPDKRQTEWETIQSVAKNNNFPQHLLLKLNWQILHNDNNKRTGKDDKKIWTTFTFHSPKIRKITNLFKNTNIGIAFKITKTLHHLIKPIKPTRLQEHEKSGIYKITCKICHKAYVGQTGRNLKSRFREHIRYSKNNDPRSAYALHIPNCRHEYGTIDDSMTLLKQISTPNLLFPYEQVYIQSFQHNNEHIPNKIWTSIFLYLTSFIQILNAITQLKPNPQSHAFQPVLFQPVHEMATYRVSTFQQ